MKQQERANLVLLVVSLLAAASIGLAALFAIAPVWQLRPPPVEYHGIVVSESDPADAPAQVEPGPPELINLNTAGVQRLMQLPGVGQTRAEAIVAYREAHGPFATAEDVAMVKGISLEMVDGWAGLVEVADPDPIN